MTDAFTLIAYALVLTAGIYIGRGIEQQTARRRTHR